MTYVLLSQKILELKKLQLIRLAKGYVCVRVYIYIP